MNVLLGIGLMCAGIGRILYEGKLKTLSGLFSFVGAIAIFISFWYYLLWALNVL